MENKDLGLVLLIIGALGFSEQITKILKLKKMYKFVYYVFEEYQKGIVFIQMNLNLIFN